MKMDKDMIELIKYGELYFKKIDNKWYAKNKRKKVQLEMTNVHIKKILDECLEEDFEPEDIMHLLLITSLTIIERRMDEEDG
jgi:IS30 family transposase